MRPALGQHSHISPEPGLTNLLKDEERTTVFLSFTLNTARMLLLNTSTAGIFQREPPRQLGRREPPLPAPGPRLADAAARRRTAQSLGAPYAATRTHAIRAAAAIRSPPLPGLPTLAVLALTGLARRRARQAAYVTWVEPLAV